MCSMRCFLFLFWLFELTYGQSVRIGGLFYSGNQDEALVFKEAVSYSNSNGGNQGIELEAVIEFVPELNSFLAGREACKVMATGVAALFGPQAASSAVHVQSLCDAKEIPHIETRWDILQRREGCSINLHPHPAYITKALISVIEKWGWSTFAIIYENDLALTAMSELLQMSVADGYSVMVRRLGKENKYYAVLKEVQRSNCKNIILDCSLEILPDVLAQAQQVGLMIADFNYIITNLDLYTLDLDFLMHGGTNITGFRLIDNSVHLGTDPIKIRDALLYDAIQLFTTSLSSLTEGNIRNETSVYCFDDSSWAHGYTVINFMKSTEMKGKTGFVKFDQQGFRTDFDLSVMELTEDGLQDIGNWNVTRGLNITRPESANVSPSAEVSMVNQSFIVLIAMANPYGMLKEDSKQLSGNNRFEGFGIDIIKDLSGMLGFNYTFVVQHDNKYGSLDKKTNQWNGMLREIMDGRAHLAITDLTITHDRESVVDFTMPFMNLGISILYKIPTKEAPSLFSFLSPFSNEVWGYMLGAYVGVSVLMFVMARISPYEWTNPYPCIEDPEVLENQFSLKNSLWFTIGSLMQQGSDIAPTAVSTRMVAGIWWFFTLIMVSSYTANLAAFLTVESTNSPINNVRELADNEKGIMYGAKKGGSTLAFFQNSDSDPFQKMYKYMEEHQDEVMTETNEEGVDWVVNRDYAYLMESTSIEYITERNCNVTQVGGLLDSKGYGIAMKKDSSYRNALSSGVLQLQETGRLSELHRKWWKEKRGGGACSEGEKSTEANELDLKNVGGVFVVLVGGVFLACFITIFEMLYNIGQVSRKEKVNFKEELLEELRFVAKCHGSTKPVRKRRGSEGEEDEDEAERPNHFQSLPSIVNLGGWFENNEKKTPLT